MAAMKKLASMDVRPVAGRWKALLPVGLISLSMGCSMSDSVGPVPEAAAHLSVSPGVPTARVFDCARTRLSQLRQEEALWDHEVTVEDIGRGVLETGNFTDDNVSGFRVQLRHDVGAGTLDVRLRGAGAYFVDQGVEQALVEFREGFESCVGATPRD